MFTAAIAIVERLYDLLRTASPEERTSLEPLERIAQSIASTSANAVLPAVVTLAGTGGDDAARAVQSACLAVAAARRHVRDPRSLRRLALAALLVDAGRARLAGHAGVDLQVFRELPEELDALAPACSAALAVASARSPALESAAATAFEVAWLERPRLGPLYGGELDARLSSRLLLVVRRLLARIAPRGTDAPVSPLDALSALLSEEDADVIALGILVDAIGILPVGTVVELESGEWAIVTPSQVAAPLERPVLRLLTNSKGVAHDRPPLLEPDRSFELYSALPASATRFNLARAFFQSKND
jgi:hypothetical protein